MIDSTAPINVLLVSHCNFEGNSSYHVLALARAMLGRGIRPAICIPDNLHTVEIVGRQPFEIATYDSARTGDKLFDGQPPALIHAFTPREHVREFVESVAKTAGCPYIVHLEDNERVIVEDEIGPANYSRMGELPFAISDQMLARWRTHPVRGPEYLAGAAGLSAVMDRLLDDQPKDIPSRVLWPGFDQGAAQVIDSAAIRQRFGISPSDLIMVYTGNIHQSNVEEVRSLYLAVALLRRAGYPARLVKTGWNHVDMDWVRATGAEDAVTDLGYVARERVWEVLGFADILVQPGRPSEFNDFRFPSKLPDFLVSGRPVVLPRTNIGRFLVAGEEAVLLERGDADEICTAVSALADDPERRERIGLGGRAFAEKNLRWDRAAAEAVSLYHEVLSGREHLEGRRVSRPAIEPPVKLIAFYLPQFHPIPENDAWWGEGFTEWTNVKRAQQLFRGHYQPQAPADGEYYDLRDPSVMERQAALARAYGIYGFCFYYYWFNGRRVLESPLEQMLVRQKPDLPFCYCWANENWTRRWDGLDDDILLAQEYTGDWADRFIAELLPVFADSRYIRVRENPLLLVYRANLVPDIRGVVGTWRATARKELGHDLHLAAVQSFGVEDPRPYGFDSAVEFPPHTERFLLEYGAVEDVASDFEGYLEDYVQVMQHQIGRELPEYEWFRGAMPSWDNTARRNHLAHVLVGSGPDRYQEWLRKLVLQTLLRSAIDSPLLFINAWNEWAEGTHLEPDDRYGHAWLEATHNALVEGALKYYELLGHTITRAGVVEHLRYTLPPVGDSVFDPASSVAPQPPGASDDRSQKARKRKGSLTTDWFADSELEAIADRYASYAVTGLGYATVRDFVDSWEYLRPLATAQGDLKDVQRPWALKAILSSVPRGGRLLEIGAGQPYVADILARLGYEVWVVDPYDGSGNGPVDFETFRTASPMINFVRRQFGEETAEVPAGLFQCVYSISVLEHIDTEPLDAVMRETKRALTPTGLTLHAVDHVCRGNGEEEHFTKLKRLVTQLGLADGELEHVLARAQEDTETYFLSAESHNRWRGSTPYDDFPMRVCVSVHVVGRRLDLGLRERCRTEPTVR